MVAVDPAMGAPGVAAEGCPADDPRVVAVLEVLAGEPAAVVGHRWGVEPALLQRWVRVFVTAGADRVANRPDERTAHQRDRFLAAVAHETRTPLSIAQGWIAMARDGGTPDAELGDVLQMVHGALERLGERLVDLELLAACSMGRVRVRPRMVPVAELGAGLPSPVVRGTGWPTTVRVDPDLFRRVLRDLWWAAGLPPTPRSRWVEIEAIDPWIEIRVRRDADPMDVRTLQALFEPFDLNDDATGVTIGLYLARALTVAHGGTIGVDQDDQGAVLWVRIPERRGATDQG